MDIAFVDSDDCIEPDYLEQLYQTAKKYHADVVNCGYRTVKEDGTTLTEVSVSPFETITDYGRTGIFVVWAKLFRTSLKKSTISNFRKINYMRMFPFPLPQNTIQAV